jgi:hypothetical protein
MSTPPESEDTSPFRRFLESAPVVYGLIGAAITAVTGLVAPERLIPEPLQNLKPLVSLYVAAAFLLAWAFRGTLKRHFQAFAVAMFLLVVTAATMNVSFVRSVTYSRESDTIERYFLVGMTPVNAEDRGRSPEDLIKQAGDGWDDVLAIWGPQYRWIVGAYAASYLLLVLSVVLSVAASELAQPRKRPRT